MFFQKIFNDIRNFINMFFLKVVIAVIKKNVIHKTWKRMRSSLILNEFGILRSRTIHYFIDCEKPLILAPEKVWKFVNSKRNGLSLLSAMSWSNINFADGIANFFQTVYMSLGPSRI